MKTSLPKSLKIQLLGKTRLLNHLYTPIDKDDGQLCSLPKLSLEADTNQWAFKTYPPIVCSGKEIFVNTMDGLRLKSPLNTEQCVYNEIEWVDDRHANYSNLHVEKNPPFLMNISSDFFFVSCYKSNASKTPDHEQFFAQVIRKPSVIQRIKETPHGKHSLQMNVLIMILDSMSHMSYQRKVPKTYALLKNELGAVILNKYTIVGDGTTCNFIPLLTGHLQSELPETRRRHNGSTFVDCYPFIWNTYKQNGYTTCFAEDLPNGGAFQFRLKGFKDIPVDHYLRPFWQMALESDLKRHSRPYCLGYQIGYLYQLNYFKDFVRKYSDVPKFGINFHTEFSHDDNNLATVMDDDLANTLMEFKRDGTLNNTLLVVMADHGARYDKVRHTMQGKLEERMPMMSLTFPEWFKLKYPNYYKNLVSNADKVTTAFDVHATLMNLLDITQAEIPPNDEDRGISLLLNIPLSRTCADAGIDKHWCVCKDFYDADLKHEAVTKIANKLMDLIIWHVENATHLCAKLSLSAIKDAKLLVPNSQRDKEKNSDVLTYQVIIETEPNKALYEGTGTISKDFSQWQVSSELSRINMFGSQARCVEEILPEIRIYCLCRDWKHW